MTERDNEAAYQRKVSEARRIVDDEMRWIMRENPKANPELCAMLLYEEAKNDRKLAAAAMLAAAASISEDVVREQQARKRKLRRPWPLLRGLAYLGGTRSVFALGRQAAFMCARAQSAKFVLCIGEGGGRNRW